MKILLCKILSHENNNIKKKKYYVKKRTDFFPLIFTRTLLILSLSPTIFHQKNTHNNKTKTYQH